MARFQVHRLREERILLLDLQSDALEMLKTRVVAATDFLFQSF